jgi:hypothetical protein
MEDDTITTDQEVRNQLMQNLLILMGVSAASEMSNAGRNVSKLVFEQVMSYLLAPTEGAKIVAPIIMYG